MMFVCLFQKGIILACMNIFSLSEMAKQKVVGHKNHAALWTAVVKNVKKGSGRRDEEKSVGRNNSV
jgi:hypothetical protein